MSTLTILRTDTVFAKLPIHTLTKSVPIDIRINQTNARGVHELHWSVSPSAAYGAPQLLAYKLDTLVINRHLDALQRPLPSLICLGSLRQIYHDLGQSRGKSTSDLKRAFHQNAGVYITAKLHYRDLEGKQRRLEAGFHRYGVVFTGESLPDGSTADAVYVILHESYRQVLNSAPTRPVDYDYLKGLKPLAQRFYELLSFKMYAALKYHHPRVSMRYSELCQFAPQHRHADGSEMSKQMSRVHQPHLHAGYLTDVQTERVVDPDGRPDWLLHYTPGPKAQAEYQVFAGQIHEGRSSRRMAAGRNKLEVDVSDRADMAAFDPISVSRKIPLHATGADDIQGGPDPVRGDSQKPCASGQQPVVSIPLTQSVSKRMTRDESSPQDPELTSCAAELVQQFYREFHGVTDKTPDAKELAHARSLLAERDPEFPTFFVQFACRTAREASFTPNVFGGLMSYKGAALAAYDRHRAQQAKASAQAAEARESYLQQQYTNHCQAQVAAYRESLSLETLAELEEEIRMELTRHEKIHRSVLKWRLKAELYDRLLSESGVPAFDDWLDHRAQSTRATCPDLATQSPPIT